MRREFLPIETLPSWAVLNDISADGVAFRRLRSLEDGTDKGSAIVATRDRRDDGSGLSPQVLLTIPLDMVLSLQSVENHAKSDGSLREVLDAVGDYGRMDRGAILIFLIIQMTHSSPDFAEERHRVGLSGPWTEYLKYMPSDIPLPTLYTPQELELLRGTSLRIAVDAKLAALDKEFENLRQATEGISWCQKYWWDEKTGRLTLDDWKYVDALYRSRMVDLPGSGHAMVPCVDMANHASESAVKALYDEDDHGNPILQLRRGKELKTDDEVTISYGGGKSASEMVFSYGFLDREMGDAKQLFLDLDIPDDDPLKIAKKMFCRHAPGFKLSSNPGATEPPTTSWDSPIVWWACVNEEDGLNFKVLQTTDGAREPRATWKGEDMDHPDALKEVLAANPQFDIFQLRAVVTILERLETQFFVLRQTERVVSEISEDENMRAIFRPDVFKTIVKLRELESQLMERGIEDLESQRQNLMNSEAVRAYLSQGEEQAQPEEEDDFS